MRAVLPLSVGAALRPEALTSGSDHAISCNHRHTPFSHRTFLHGAICRCELSRPWWGRVEGTLKFSIAYSPVDQQLFIKGQLSGAMLDGAVKALLSWHLHCSGGRQIQTSK